MIMNELLLWVIKCDQVEGLDNEEIIKILITEFKADPSYTNELGHNFIVNSMINGHFELIRNLIEGNHIKNIGRLTDPRGYGIFHFCI